MNPTNTIVSACAHVVRIDPWCLIYEDGLRAGVVAHLFSNGRHQVFGSRTKNTDKKVTRYAGKPKVHEIARANHGFKDGRIVFQGKGYAWELKTCPEVGSKDIPQKSHFWKDVSKVVAGLTDVAVFALTDKGYRCLRKKGKKHAGFGFFPNRHTRGRWISVSCQLPGSTAAVNLQVRVENVTCTGWGPSGSSRWVVGIRLPQ